MAQNKEKSVVQIAGENEAMAADNVTPDPDYIAAVKAQEAEMDSTLQAERIIALEEAENNADPIPNDDFIRQLDNIRRKAKRKESMKVAQRMTMLDHLDLLDLKLTDFVKGPGIQGLLRHINEEGE